MVLGTPYIYFAYGDALQAEKDRQEGRNVKNHFDTFITNIVIMLYRCQHLPLIFIDLYIFRQVKKSVKKQIKDGTIQG